jgi:hypothetical protein
MARDRLIYVVSDVHDTPEHAAVLRDANAPLAGQVVCNAQVGSRSLAALGRMVGHAIGKRFEMTGAPKNAQRLWDWMSACLIAGGTNLLVVNRAQNLDPKLWLDLFEFAAISNCDLVLVTQSRSRSQREIIRAWPIQEVPWEFLAARIAVVSAEPEPTAVPKARPALVGTDVPLGVDFPHFLRAAARVLAPCDYEAVADVWRDACTEAMQLVDHETSRDDILRFALTNLDRAATVIEDGVRIRGCQFGLFLRGYLLWVDDVRFATALEHGRLSPLDAATARQVLKYPCTQRAHSPYSRSRWTPPTKNSCS